MGIYISDWIHKFQNKTGLDAKANLELYKSKRVCSVPALPGHMAPGFVIFEEPCDHLLRLEPGRFQMQAAVGHLPLHCQLALLWGVGVQRLAHLLELLFQVFQEFLAVLVRPVTDGVRSGGLR